MFSLILHGRSSIELQKWRHLRFAANLLQKASSFSTASTVSSHKGQIFTVSYLVDSLGLTTKLAESISKKITSFDGKRNPDSVLNLLRNHSFTDSQISTIITTYPGLLLLDAEKSLGPKLQFLQSRGGGDSTSSSDEFTEIVSKVPRILEKKGNKTISLYYDFVKCIIEEKVWPEEVNKPSNKLRNVLVLRGLGMPQKLLFTLLISNYQPIYGKEKFEASLKKVIDNGFDPRTSKFVQALHVVYQMSEKTIEEKIDVYKRLGFEVDDVWEIFKKWPFSLKFSEKKINQTFEILEKKCGLLKNEVLTVVKKHPQLIRISEKNVVNSVETFVGLGFSRDEVKRMIKRFPQCLHLSVETVKKKTEFLVKKMDMPLKAVVSSPQLLGYNLEKRTVPRCNVIKALMAKGLVGSELSLSTSSVMAVTDEAFLNKYVRKQEDKKLVAELMTIFTTVYKADLDE
uniref:Transcription termination factor 3, mitochondrial n=2 Tax=Noccaea caerulescens TaxID=107243 RepID=A0A1J3GI16_NOCCA